MNPSNLAQIIGANGRMFTLFVAVGAVVAVGVRSRAAHDSHPKIDPVVAKAPAHAPSSMEMTHEAPIEPLVAEDDSTLVDDEPKPSTSPKELPTDVKEEKPLGVLLQLGNAACPVMGGDVDGKTFTEWKGLRIDHCCPPCSARFLKNPESLLDEVSRDWREAFAAAQEIDSAAGEERAALLASASKRWKVLREPAKAVVDPTPADVFAGGLLVDLGNAECPVMGGGVDGKTITEWNGMQVNHCCPGCSKRFLKDPETLLDDVSPDWRSLRDAVVKFDAKKGDERAAALDAIRARWTLVREPDGVKATGEKE